MSAVLIKNANIFTPEGDCAVRGEDMQHITNIPYGVLLAEDGIIRYVGSEDKLPDIPDGCEIIDAGGKALIPGFVDSHTHLVFGGYRPDEFEWRLKGDTYMSIMERGGGIQSTVNATHNAPIDELTAKAEWFVKRMHEMGVTTVEAKSGYGLDNDTELKMLEVISHIADQEEETGVEIISTFLGAHAVPKEYKGRTSEYVDFIIGDMIPKVKGKAEFFDIFTEKNVFEIDDSRRMMRAPKMQDSN